MMRGFVIFLIAGLYAAPARAEPFVDMVRELNALQDRMAVGDAAARQQTARQFDLIEKTIQAADPATWSDERNARSAIVYLLSGGASGKLRDIAAAKQANENLSPLLGASLQYAEGEPGARKALTAFDARQYPATLGAHLALVQGSVLTGVDNARAIALFDLARLLMPGSLVEEAALRREIAILDPAHEGEKLSLLAVRYALKYLASPFARHFWETFPDVALGAVETRMPASRFDLVLDKAPPAERLAFYLSLSRRALLAGNFPEADKAIEKADRPGLDAPGRKRVATYRTVLAMLKDEEGPPSRRAIDASQLSAEDAAVVKLAESVRAKLDIASGPGAPAPSQEEEKTDMEAAVQRALAQSDELLKRANRR